LRTGQAVYLPNNLFASRLAIEDQADDSDGNNQNGRQ
jgi:hypothetical protein